MVDIRNQVGRKRTVHFGGLWIRSSYRPAVNANFFTCRHFWRASPATKRSTRIRNQQTVSSRESWQKPLRERTPTCFSLGKERRQFLRSPRLPSISEEPIDRIFENCDPTHPVILNLYGVQNPSQRKPHKLLEHCCGWTHMDASDFNLCLSCTMSSKVLSMATNRRFESATLPTLFFVCVLGCISGCATTEFAQLREKPHNPLTERLNTTAFGLVKHSERTELFLRQTGYQGS